MARTDSGLAVGSLRALKGWLLRSIAGRALRSSRLANLANLPPTLQLPLRRTDVDPVPELAELREREPVARLASLLGMSVWLVTGYDEVRQVLADSATYSNDIRPVIGKATATGPEAIGGLGFTDPPDHTRLRKYLTPEFTRRRLLGLQPRIAAIVDAQLDEMARLGPDVDLVQAFAFPIPFLVICELLGMPKDQREEFRRLGTERFDASSGIVGVFGAASQGRTFLFEFARQQRKAPNDGLIGRLVTQHGNELSDVELGGFADGLFLGGYETSASMLSLGSYVLLRNPAAYARIAEDADWVAGAVDELLRYLTVVQVAFPRFAREDHELFGQQIAKGDVVACSLSGADRAAVFGPDAERFDPDRSPAARHLAFGYGMHRCVGAELAQLELQTAFPRLARRFPHLALSADPEALRFRALSIVYGLDEMPVCLHGSRRVVAPTQPPVPVP